MLDALDTMRDGVEWCVCAFGPAENEVTRLAYAKGGHMRVGFENNFQRRDGSRAEHTADLVADAVAAVKAADRSLMTAANLRRAIALWR